MARVTDLIKKVDEAIASGKAASCAQVRYAEADNPYAGMSYVAAEAVYHAAGGIRSGLRSHMMHLGTRERHWYLVDADGKIYDPTAKQFPRKVDYSSGQPTGFATPHPSARAATLMGIIGATDG